MRLKSLAIKVPRLGVNRYGTYYVRTSVRTSVSGSRKVVQRSLGTKDPNLAKILALKFCLELVQEDALSAINKNIANYELDVRHGIAKADGAEDHARMLEAMKAMADLQAMQTQIFSQQASVAASLPASPAFLGASPLPAAVVSPELTQIISNAMAAQPKPVNVGMKLKDALDKHLDEETRTIKAATTILEKKALFRDFAEHFGDVYLNAITQLDISERWRAAEYNRPNQKRAGQTVSLARLEKRRGFLSKFFKWAKEAGHYHHPNPMQQRMGTKSEIRAKQQSYKDFSLDDLRVLFDAKYAEHMKQPDWYWVPLIALYSGARLNEIASLSLSKVHVVEGIHVLDIEDGKTVSSRRRVPIHSQLLKVGFWDYVCKLKELGFTRLLPHRPENNPGKMVGKKWGDWIEMCGILDDAKTFHSFRSTVITRLHNLNAYGAGIKRAVGHETSAIDGVHGTYVHGVELDHMRETIEAIEYKDFDLEAVRRADPGFTKELLKFREEALRDKQRLEKQAQRKQALARSRKKVVASSQS